MVSFINKLMTLTNGTIEAVGTTTAKQVRNNMVNDVFPLLSIKEKADISAQTEFNDVARMVEADFGHFLCDEGIRKAAEDSIKHFRHSELQQEHENILSNRESDSKMSLTYLHRLMMLANADLVDTAGDKAYEKRRAIVAEIFPSLTHKEKAEIADKTELDDVMRVLSGAFPNFPQKAIHSIAEQTVHSMKLTYLNQKIKASKAASPSSNDDMNWEPF